MSMDGRNTKKSESIGGGGINSNSNLPIGDPFERILTTPKESLIRRTASPRRSTASPLKSSSNGSDTCFEILPKISGNLINLFKKNECHLLCFVFVCFRNESCVEGKVIRKQIRAMQVSLSI